MFTNRLRFSEGLGESFAGLRFRTPRGGEASPLSMPTLQSASIARNNTRIVSCVCAVGRA